jgi:hypothetical protein
MLLYRLFSDCELLLCLIEHSAVRTHGGGRVNVYFLLVFDRPPLWFSGQSSWHTTEMYCVSCEVQTEFIYVI